MWGRVSACLVIVLLVTSSQCDVCPDSCSCLNVDGLHKATCSSISQLYKFTLRQRHHNINILNLSHNNITKINHELDRLTELSMLDLSTNGLTQLNKLLRNAKKLVHLNLANNRIEKLSLSHLPASVSSLDLTNNLLKDVPSDLKHLKGLEHLELEGNPLNCSCQNIMLRDRLLKSNVFIDNVKCVNPSPLKGRSWLDLKKSELCKNHKTDFMDIMMGDQPIDAVQVGEETTALKSMPIVATGGLDEVVVHGDAISEDDDNVFIRVKESKTTTNTDDIEGSGAVETSTSGDDLIVPRRNYDMGSSYVGNDNTVEETTEGSGMDEGSGFGMWESEETKKIDTTTVQPPELWTGPVVPLIIEDDSEFPSPPTPTVYAGGPNWHLESPTPEVTESIIMKSAVTQATRDTTVSEPIRVTQAAEMNEQQSSSKPTTHKTGTYVCIAIIVVLLVGLIGFAIVKGQIRKRRDKRMLRQQKRDVEQASKELVDMNKSLLGKPAMIEIPLEKKLNGKYELVPTHEKKPENGDLGNGVNHKDSNANSTDSPRDTNQNKSSSRDNNLQDDSKQQKSPCDTSFESTVPSIYSKKDTHSLSSEDIFVPINEDENPRLNGTADSDISQPLLTDDHPMDSGLLSPREYIPVYSPDMGRVRIKLSETPKPKTPVLVTRSRSNAGDIIITPVDGGVHDTAT